jgi:hypothetical protein
MNRISYLKEGDLLESFEEALKEDELNDDCYGILYEVVDSAIPVYNHSIVGEWLDAGMTDPSEFDIDITIKVGDHPSRGEWRQKTIFEILSEVLYSQYQDFLTSVIGDAETATEALKRVRRELSERTPAGKKTLV